MESLTADDPQVMGEFRLRARLGSGGMGRVYLGFSPAGRAVAIKVVHAQLASDPEFLERFGREVAAARAVSGMYTAPVVAAGLDANPPWLATAFVPGPSLAEVVSRHGPLPEAAVWRLGAGLAEALRAVHTAGLVHRDLKPANVLLSSDGPHVIDFGISRAFEGTSLTSAGMVVGTPGYMSPEQAEGQLAGPPSDVFSLGCVLAFAATGTAPFGTGSAASVLYKVVTTEPDLSLVTPGLRGVIAACLAKNPAARPSLGALIATIAASGPEVPAAFGAFWPEPVASIVAAGAGYLGATGASGGMSPAGGVSPVGGSPVGGSPVAQPGYVQTAAVLPGSPGASPLPGFAGHPGMLPDGYYAAATGNAATPGAGATPVPPGTGYGATGYAATQSGGAAGWSQPGGVGGAGVAGVAGGPGVVSGPGVAGGSGAPGWSGAAGWPGAAPATSGMPAAGWPGQPTQAPWGQAPVATPAGKQQPATPWPNQSGGQTPWPQYGTGAAAGMPGAGVPGVGVGVGVGSAGAAAMQYRPGRRRPMTSEVPPHVLLSIRLMWAGLAAGVLELIFGLGALAHFNYGAKHAITRVGRLSAQSMAGNVALTAILASLLGLVCWVWLARATRSGRGWARIAAAVLAGIDTVCVLFIILGTHGYPALKVIGCVPWSIGLAAALLLWGNSARAFFLAWR